MFNYGGRGISVFHEWVNDFMEFFKYVGKAPSVKHSIDRIDNDKGYFPGNVRWATSLEQRLNQRKRLDTKYIEGVTYYKKSHKLRVQVKKDGKLISLGLFEDIEKALTALTVSNIFPSQ